MKEISNFFRARATPALTVYYPKAKPARIIKCRDGRTYRKPADRDAFKPVSVTQICDSGKYIDIRSAL